MVADNTFWDDDVPIVLAGTFSVDASNTFHQDGVGNTYSGLFWGGDAVTGAVAWTATDAPFVVVDSPLDVPEGSTLTLGPGVTVKFADGLRLGANGDLVATATTFTSIHDDTDGNDAGGDADTTAPAPGDWAYLAIRSDGTVVDGCTIRYAGSALPYTGAVSVDDGASPTVTGNVLSDNAGGTFADGRAAALNLGGAGAATVVTGNQFYANDLPLVVNGLVNVDDSNTFAPPDGGTANLLDVILMNSDYHAVEGATAWGETEVPYVLYGTVLSIEEAGVLTLADGVVVKSYDGRIDVHGALEAGEGVAFTSLLDDVRLGDTNNDGATSTPVKGDWTGINLCLGGPCQWATWGNIYYAQYP